MVFLPDRFLFIHIPRTSGMSITATLANHLTSLEGGALIGSSWYPHELRRHARAEELSEVLPNWEGLYKFAVTRNPWTAVVSDYWKMRTANLAHRTSYPPALIELREGITQAKTLPFAEWVTKRYQYVRGGHWKHFCCRSNGQSLGVDAIRFENLAEDWKRLCLKTGLPHLRLTKMNSVSKSTVEWTPKAIRFVREHFSDDIEQFRYPESP